MIKEYVNLITDFLIIFCFVTVNFLNANIGQLPLVTCVVILKILKIYFFIVIMLKFFSSVLHFDIQWKHVILGFYIERNVKTQF